MPEENRIISLADYGVEELHHVIGIHEDHEDLKNRVASLDPDLCLNVSEMADLGFFLVEAIRKIIGSLTKKQLGAKRRGIVDRINAIEDIGFQTTDLPIGDGISDAGEAMLDYLEESDSEDDRKNAKRIRQFIGENNLREADVLMAHGRILDEKQQLFPTKADIEELSSFLCDKINPARNLDLVHLFLVDTRLKAILARFYREQSQEEQRRKLLGLEDNLTRIGAIHQTRTRVRGVFTDAIIV